MRNRFIYKRKIMITSNGNILCKEYEDGSTVNYVTGQPVEEGKLKKYLDYTYYKWRF